MFEENPPMPVVQGVSTLTPAVIDKLNRAIKKTYDEVIQANEEHEYPLLSFRSVYLSIRIGSLIALLEEAGYKPSISSTEISEYHEHTYKAHYATAAAKYDGRITSRTIPIKG